KQRSDPMAGLVYHTRRLLLRIENGQFATSIASAANHVTKACLANGNGRLTPEQAEAFRQGIPLGGSKTAPAGLKLIRRADNPWYEVRLIEGRQNQIRIMFKHFGRLVEKLKRVKIGFLELGPLKPGQFRSLTSSEVARFRK